MRSAHILRNAEQKTLICTTEERALEITPRIADSPETSEKRSTPSECLSFLLTIKKSINRSPLKLR